MTLSRVKFLRVVQSEIADDFLDRPKSIQGRPQNLEKYNFYKSSSLFDKFGVNSKSYLAYSILLINVSSETLDSLKWRFHQSSDRITAPTY